MLIVPIDHSTSGRSPLKNGKDKNYVVSVTQCNMCGTLSIHWGRELDDTCTLCSETSLLINQFLNPLTELPVETFPLDQGSPDMDNGLRPEEIEFYTSNGEFTGGLNDLLNALDNASGTKSTQFLESINNRDLDELETLIPLLSSIRKSVEDNWKTLQGLLDDVNLFLETPEAHWRWEALLEIHRDSIVSVVNNLNSYIEETKLLGIDLVDCSDTTFCALAKLPEWYFVGKEDLGEDSHALFYYDGTETCFNSFSQLSMNHHSRSKINKDKP